MSDIVRWYNGVPVCTRFMVTSIFLTTLASNYGLVSPYQLIWDTRMALVGLQLWRAFTAFSFFGKLSFHFLFTLFLFYQYSKELEKTTYSGRTADYIIFLGFSAVVLLAVGGLLKYRLLGESLLMTLIYLWSQLNRAAIVTFMFGIRCRASYFPWILLAYHLLTGHLPILEMIGLLVGHLYYYLEYVYPARTGIRWIKTPAILYYYYPKRTPPGRMTFGESSTTSNFGTTSSSRSGTSTGQSTSGPSPRSYFTGSGRRLGTQ
jgi:hypothetical protein